jgi:hypothetical protein
LDHIAAYLRRRGLNDVDVAYLAGYSTPASNVLMPAAPGLRAVPRSRRVAKLDAERPAEVPAEVGSLKVSLHVLG